MAANAGVGSQSGRTEGRSLRARHSLPNYKDTLLARPDEGQCSIRGRKFTDVNTFAMAELDDLLCDVGSLAFNINLRGERIRHRRLDMGPIFLHVIQTRSFLPFARYADQHRRTGNVAVKKPSAR